MTSVSIQAPAGELIVPAQPRAEAGSVWFSLVVPTYNESENMEPLVTQVTHHLDQQLQGRYEIIIVDDNSADGTAEVVEKLGHRFPQLHVMKRVNERGLSTAVIRGWQAARGEVFGVMDGDLQHPTSALVQLVQAIQQGADIAIASRYVPEGSVGEWGPLRRLTSRGAGALAALLLPEAVSEVSDPMSGYFAVRRDTVSGVVLKPKGYKILLEVLARANARKVVEVPFEFALRQHGQTKVTWRQYAEYLSQLLELRVHLWFHPKKSMKQ